MSSQSAARPALRLAVRELRGNRTQHMASIVVAAIGAILGAILIEAENMLQSQSAGGGFYVHAYVPLLLGVLGIVFVAIATFVAVIVTINTFAIVMAGRAQRTALFRLLGATADTLRKGVAIEGAVVGFIGSLLGTVIGVIAAAITGQVLISMHVFIALPMNYFSWQLIFPLIVGTLATTISAWIGTRNVVEVSPVAALGRIQEPSFEHVRQRTRSQRSLVIWLAVIGILLLIAGVCVGVFTPYGLLLAVPGGALSFLGFIIGTRTIIPKMLQFVGRIGSKDPAVRLAAANAIRYPARAARSTVGLIIGITLVTMFCVAGQTYSDVANKINSTLPPSQQDAVNPFLGLVMGVVGILIGFSLLIAAVGLINSLRLSVLQRTQEIGLLRALGFSRQQARKMIFAESIQLTVVGTVCGLVLGIIYGWAGVFTAIYSDHHVNYGFPPSVPWYLVVGVLVAAALLAVLSSLIPARRAMAISPVRATESD